MNKFEMKQLAYQSQLKSRALQVLLYLIDRTNKEQTCFPAVSTIGRELHISISTVKRAMRELVEAGYVTKESRFREGNRGQTSNLYTLYFPEEKNVLENITMSEKPEQFQKEQSEQTDMDAAWMVVECMEGQDSDNTEDISATDNMEDRNEPKHILANKNMLVKTIKGYMGQKNRVKSDDYERTIWVREEVCYDRENANKISTLLKNGKRNYARIFPWTGEWVNLIPP